MWDNVCIVAGSVVSNRQARVATQAVLKYQLELPLSNQERQVISNLLGSGWADPEKANGQNHQSPGLAETAAVHS